MSSSSGSLLAWGAFIVGVCLLLAIDLGVFHRKPRRVGFREAGLWTAFWILLSLAFNGYVWQVYGEDKAFKFLNAYIIEKALSVDNIFVFIVIFRYMRIPVAYLHRVLYAGILGAIVLRGVFIVAGLGLVNTFSWTLYLFGLFLLYTGVRLLFVSEDDGENPGDNWVKRQAERWLPVTDDYEGARFFVRRHGRMFATTLFVTLLMIETADVVFALDSIPAIFGISTDPFIVFTSNICAIMGLRAMFFLLENVLEKLRFLNAGLGLVLAFIGVKMILELGLGPALQAIHIKPETSLAVVGAILLVSIVVSLVFPAPEPPEAKPEPTTSQDDPQASAPDGALAADEDDDHHHDDHGDHGDHGDQANDLGDDEHADRPA